MRQDLRRCNILCIFLLLQYVKQAVYPKSRGINVYCRDTGANTLSIASNRQRCNEEQKLSDCLPKGEKV